MEHCIRCKTSESEIMLFDTVYEGRKSVICKRCAIIENMPITERQNNSKQENTEKQMSIFEKMKKFATFKEDKEEPFILKDTYEAPKEKEKLELINYFQWDIMRTRRRRGLTQQQLANIIGEPLLNIEKIERGELPSNYEALIKKLENFLRIQLTKLNEFEEIAKSKSKPIVLRDEYGNILDHIPEPEIILEEDEEDEEEISPIKEIIIKMEKAKQEKQTQSQSMPSFISEIDKPKPYEMPYSRGRAALRQQNPDYSTSLSQPQQQFQQNNSNIGKKQAPAEILQESGELDIEKAKLNNVTIGNLREVHKKKLQLTKEDKILEARKIEERQKLIEARKEELRLLKEKESRKLDSVLGGTELLKKGKENKPVEVLEEEDFDEDADEDFKKFEED